MAKLDMNEDIFRVAKFLLEMPKITEELNGCEDELLIDDGDIAVLASYDEEDGIYVHLEFSMNTCYDDKEIEGDEPLGSGEGWNWTIKDDKTFLECLNGIKYFLDEVVIDFPIKL